MEFRRQMEAEANGLFTCGGQCRRWCRRLGRRLLCGKEEPESRYIRLNAARPTPHRFPSNRLVNTKYTALSFLPKVCSRVLPCAPVCSRVLSCAPVCSRVRPCSRPASGAPASRDTQRSSPQRGSPSLDSVLGSLGAPLSTAPPTCLAGAVRAVLVLFQPVLPAGGGVAVLPATHARASLLVRRAARLRARRHHEQGGVRRPPALQRGPGAQPPELREAAAWRDRRHGAGARAGRRGGAGAADTDQPARACGRGAAAHL